MGDGLGATGQIDAAYSSGQNGLMRIAQGRVGDSECGLVTQRCRKACGAEAVKQLLAALGWGTNNFWQLRVWVELSWRWAMGAIDRDVA